jgi:hypothetical protein
MAGPAELAVTCNQVQRTAHVVFIADNTFAEDALREHVDLKGTWRHGW